MGVDITHIIKNNFRNIKDHNASLRYAEETLEILKNKLRLYENEDLIDIKDDGEEISFYLPVYDVEMSLHNGFWQIESFFHYCQIVMHQGDNFWLRRSIFDIARALGQKEAWHAEEYYTWNGGNIEDFEVPFEDWLAFAEKKYGKPIPEFDQDAIIKQGDVHILDYEPIYKDNFKECISLFEKEQSRLDGYKLLGLKIIDNRYYRCLKEEILYLIDIETLKPII